MCRYDFIMLLLFRNILSVLTCQNNQCLPSSFLRWNYCSKGEELQCYKENDSVHNPLLPRLLLNLQRAEATNDSRGPSVALEIYWAIDEAYALPNSKTNLKNTWQYRCMSVTENCFTHTASHADYRKFQDACGGVIPQTRIMACVNLNTIRIKLL